ncbi:hypothetical protein UVI_02058990 [Ustilaginoidea virens]|nr:hypothetical protein UVI_02058990 [Ustilaginoidea virens]
MSRLWKSPSAQKVGQFSRDSSIQPRRTQSLCVNTIRSSSPNSQLRNRVLRLSAVRKSLPLSEEDFLDKDDEAIYSSEEQSDDRSKPGIARHSTSTESLPSVQSWLESSLRPYPRACRNEECAKPVPLPSDAVETLRVSVACFPETMLLTSSLTVETIRSYARKVRQPSMNRGSIEPSESPAREARKSLWRKAATYKCGSETGHSKSSSREATTRPWDGSCEDSDRPKPWAPIKNVFGCCSDYLSDALYAHIVAYNYVSALTVGDPSPHASRVRRNNATTACGRGSQQQQQQQHLDVPEKAARLLGLLAEPDMAAGTNRLSKRPGSPRADWHGPDMPTSCEGGPSAQDNNNTLRAIQSGLLRCVSRLVATAKLTAGMGAGQDGMADTEAEEGADMLLMRSLCEIVRIAEESS